MRLLVTLGEGGHTTEMLRLVDLLATIPGAPYEYHYLTIRQDPLCAQRIRIPGPVYSVTRIRWKKDPAWRAALRLVQAAVESLRVLRQARPAAILTSGPALAIPLAGWARLLRIPVIFIETGSRVHALSLTGRLIRPLANLYIVQWPELLPLVPGAVYAGRLL